MFVYVSWTFLKTLVLVGCYIDTLREVGGRIVNLKKLRGGPTRPALQRQRDVANGVGAAMVPP